MFGVHSGERVSPEWAAWANGVAVRELDFHDTFLAADYSHPGDNIPPILAVAQHAGAKRRRPDPRHRHRLRDPDRPRARDLPARAQDRPHRASRPVRRRRHRHAARPASGRRSTRPCSRRCTSLPPRASRARARSRSWKAYAPAHAGKLAIEAVDRAMRGEGAPSPIYEGEDSVIAWMLGGPKAEYHVPLPGAGRGEARDPRHLHQGALRRVPEPGADRPRVPHARRRSRTSREIERDRHPHQPPHARRDRHRRERSAEDGPEGEPRDARPLHHVHLRRRAAGRRVAPRQQLLRAGARRRAPTPCALWHKIETARGPGVDAPLPLHRSRREGLRRPRRGHAARTAAVIDGRDRGRRTRIRSARARSRRDDYIGKFRQLAEGIVADGRAGPLPRLSRQRLPTLRAGELRRSQRSPSTRRRLAAQRGEGASSDARVDRHRHAVEKRAAFRRRACRRGACCASPARSRRWSRCSSRSSASTASTSPAPCSPPTSGCPTSA